MPEGTPLGLVASSFIVPHPCAPSCHAATIAPTDRGMIAAFFSGSAEGASDVGIWLSDRHESGWSAPRQVASAEGGHPCWNPVLFGIPHGPLLLFYKVGPNCADWWAMLTVSHDGGRTWSHSQPLPARTWGPIRNKPVLLADGWADENQPKGTRVTKIIFSCFCSARAN